MDPERLKRLMEDFNRSNIAETIMRLNKTMPNHDRMVRENEALKRAWRNVARHAKDYEAAVARIPEREIQKQLAEATRVANSGWFKNYSTGVEDMNRRVSEALSASGVAAAQKVAARAIQQNQEIIQRATRAIDIEGLDKLIRDASELATGNGARALIEQVDEASLREFAEGLSDEEPALQEEIDETEIEWQLPQSAQKLWSLFQFLSRLYSVLDFLIALAEVAENPAIAVEKLQQAQAAAAAGMKRVIEKINELNE